MTKNHPTADIPGRTGVKLAWMIRPDQTARMRLAAQMGLRFAIADVKSELDKVSSEQYVSALINIRGQYEALGLKIAAIESHPVPFEKILLGLPGRDEELDNYCAAVEAAGKAGIPIICYHFMAGIGWHRSNVRVRARGGALTSEFDLRAAEQQGLTQWGEVSADQIWSNLDYFLKKVIPVAEKAGVKMALHPDDPPVPVFRGISRIMTNAAGFRRALSLVPSPANGITFCQANFKLMDEDIEALVREWGARKIFFVHFRDVEGTPEHFVETFHDDGPTDMGRMLELYSAVGFDGPIRPDHAPTMEGESNEHPGYETLGKIFAFGYMKGLLAAKGIPPV